MSKQTAIMIMLLVTVIWGGGFPATKLALDFGVTVGITNMVRGAIFTVLVFAVFHRQILTMKKKDIKIGLFAGTANVLAFLLQTIGTQYTTLSNSAFLTTTNVIMIPFMVWVLMKKRPVAKNFVAMGICMVGTAVLAGAFKNGLVFNIGDLYTLGCAFFYGLSIVLVAMQPNDSHFSVSAFMMGLTHFLGGLLYFVVAEGAHIPPLDWKIAILPVLYLGIFSSFTAQTLQILSQRYVSPNTASLVFMFESVFGSIFSILFGFEEFTVNLLIGGGLIMLSLMISELNLKKKKTKV